MPGTLFVVATPIGNLEDITLRALRVLREVALIAAEDTRRTAKLLTHYGITTPRISFHQHNTRSRMPQLLQRLEAGESVALVTDAGTPGVSDPGVELVQACLDRGLPVDPIPGASAPLTAAIASGFPLIPLTVYGFAPSRSKDRTAFIKEIAGIPTTVTFFETPHRIAQTLAYAQAEWGERQIMVGRELTKLHQQFLRGTASAVAEQLGPAKGEFTVVVGPKVRSAEDDSDFTDTDIVHEFGVMTEEMGLSRGATIASVAKKLGRPRRDVFAAIERAKTRTDDQ